ncbi:MAG TPA: LysE family transporter [Geopsychrobacteraceae bacterium]|nr:LysE family transporter [Geopsychrobacteraceae bacterium]
MEYLGEFLTIAFIHLLAVASPGPDFAIVLRQSIVVGRTPALWTSIGIGIGIMVHVAYCLLGLGLIISQSIMLFNLIKLIGACYLLYVGWKSLRAKPTAVTAESDFNVPIPRAVQALRIGFLTNALNPKATLFFLSLFSVVINPDTPATVQLGYGIYMCFATAIWFCGLSLFLTQPKIRFFFTRFGHWTERVMGAALIALGLKLALASRK